jgi:CubicO group peptidase (beta-lactamase class C family)
MANARTYTTVALHEYLQSYKPTPDTRSWSYSNVGMGLLGNALARRAGADYATLIHTRITDPLGMRNTGIALTPTMQKRAAHGHFADLRPAPDWVMPSLEGAASLHSTSRDMVRLLRACLGYERTTLAPAMASMFDVRRPGPDPSVAQAIGWLVSTHEGAQYVQFSGATAGFSAFMSMRPDTRQGIVALSNSAGPVGDLANHLIRPNSPLSRARPRIVLPVETLARYEGTYEAGAVSYTITHGGEALMIRPPNLQMDFALFPENEARFYAPQLNLDITFVFDEAQHVTGLRAGRDAQVTPKRP